MIKFLRIRNLATIEDIRMDFEDGFSILTGETGAGKSIIIDSIRLVCGDKGSSDLVRTGRPEASVEAIFSTRASREERGELPLAEGGDLILQRLIASDGSGKAYCDGVLAPVKKFKDISAGLVDIYGQNDHMFLLHLDSHLDYLDQYAGALALREETAALAQEWRRLLKLRAEWKTKERERSQRLDFLEFQIREIEKADLKPGEEEELRAQRNILKNAEKISALVDQALDLSYSGEASISGQLARLGRVLEDLAAFDPAFAEMKTSVDPVDIVIDDISDGLAKYKDKQDLTPEKLEKIEERLSLIETLKRKYSSEIRDIAFYLDTIKAEHQALSGIQVKLAAIEDEIAKAGAEYTSRAKALTEIRTRTARDLERLIEKEIGLLGMKKARFHVRVESAAAPDPLRVRDSGLDDVEFLISPNPGEPLKPLRKIASGGELSRIMLALKALGKERGGFKTLIFDEIDAGIGGKTAEFIAQKLKSLARTHQILCITHLPQIASFAVHHYKIEKRIEKDRTFTTVSKLGFEERVEEIARLMTGSRITGAALESARDMLRHNAGDAPAGRKS